MDDKNVTLVKKELIQFLKKNNAVAVYFWTIYGHEYNSKTVKNTLEKIKYEKSPSVLCQLYKDLIGKIKPNHNIKDEAYEKSETLYNVYKKWCKYIDNMYFNWYLKQRYNLNLSNL